MITEHGEPESDFLQSFPRWNIGCAHLAHESYEAGKGSMHLGLITDLLTSLTPKNASGIGNRCGASVMLKHWKD